MAIHIKKTKTKPATKEEILKTPPELDDDAIYAQSFSTPSSEALEALSNQKLVRYCIEIYRRGYGKRETIDTDLVAVAANEVHMQPHEAFKVHARAVEVGLLFPNGMVSQYLLAQSQYFTMKNHDNRKQRNR